MSQYPQYYYSSSQYQPLFWQGVITVILVIALGAWAFSLVRKTIKGEEVKLSEIAEARKIREL